MTSLSEVRIVVVAYGHEELLERTLAGLQGEFDVLVVDNSSSEAVAAVAFQRSARYIDPGRNGGFATGVNLGLAETFAGDDRHVLLLNPDAVVAPEQVERLLAALDSEGAQRVAAVSPALLGEDGRLQRVMWPFPHPARAWLEALGLGRLNRAGQFAVGSVLLLRQAAIVDVGHFDERFFLYAEETDWQRRAASRGWSSSAVYDVVVSHIGGGTSSDPMRRERLFHAGTETYIRKWFGRRGWIAYRIGAWFGARLRAALLPGHRGDWARVRADIYRRGPRAVSGIGVD